MDDMSTNRDLYLAITELARGVDGAPTRTLEEFLRALLRLCRSRTGVDGLSAEEFVAVLRDAFVVEPLAYDPAWAAQYRRGASDLRGFATFEAIALQQIVDLREMHDAGILAKKWIELGVDAPRGGRWFNFEPTQYLECAAAGSIGGWEPGDATGRSFVPGPVAVTGPDGEIISAAPEDIDRPIRPVSRVTWEQFADFLYCGQTYE